MDGEWQYRVVWKRRGTKLFTDQFVTLDGAKYFVTEQQRREEWATNKLAFIAIERREITAWEPVE